MVYRGWTLWVKSKYVLFRFLEFLSAVLRQNADPKSSKILGEPVTKEERKSKDNYIWFFVSTIGELNAIGPLIKQIIIENPKAGIVFLTDHDQYTQSYQWQYPESYVIYHGDSAHGLGQYFDKYPPKIFLISEIPCNYADAPCRFSFRVLYELKLRGVPVLVVNGWLYREAISCRMDEIESHLFSSEYLLAIDKFLVQTQEIAEFLIGKGASKERVSVTGNIKFDALALENGWRIENTKSPRVLKKIINAGRPCIVAGCVAEFGEAKILLTAYLHAKESKQDLLFIIAPRHPENFERMNLLVNYIDRLELRFVQKSKIKEESMADIDVIILDTIGELRDFYAISTFSYVGMNHNILEPLMYNKKVIILPGWEKNYPTYPVYKKLKSLDFVKEIEDEDGYLLGMAFIDQINKSLTQEKPEDLKKKLALELSGATERDLYVIRQYLQ